MKLRIFLLVLSNKNQSCEYTRTASTQTLRFLLKLQKTLQLQSNQASLNNFNDLHNQHSPNSRPLSLSSPSVFRTSPHQLKATTLRPNYSHLFVKTHQHNTDPSQTETFLGQITLQNPIESPPTFDSFQKGDNFPDKMKDVAENEFNEEGNGNSIMPSKKPDFLNHRYELKFIQTII